MRFHDDKPIEVVLDCAISAVNFAGRHPKATIGSLLGGVALVIASYMFLPEYILKKTSNDSDPKENISINHGNLTLTLEPPNFLIAPCGEQALQTIERNNRRVKFQPQGKCEKSSQKYEMKVKTDAKDMSSTATFHLEYEKMESLPE